MSEEVRIILDIDDSGSIPLEDAPEGVHNLEYEMSRSVRYWGMFPVFVGRLGFVGDGKDYVDNVVDTSGKEAIITVDYQTKNPETIVYSTLVEGILNLLTSERTKTRTHADFEGNTFETKLNKRSDIEIPYNRLTSLDGTVLSGFTYDYANLLCQGVSNDIITRAVYPHELIDSILQQILDLNYPCLYAPIFARTTITDPTTGNNYATEGRYAKKMITKATYLRGWDEDDDELFMSLNKIFAIFNKTTPLGLGFGKDVNDRNIVVIDDRSRFFQGRIMLVLDDDKASNLSKVAAEELRFNEIEIGFPEALKDVAYGLGEYVGKTKYASTSMTDRKLDLVNEARADGVGINDIIDNWQITDTTDSSEYDKAIFIIDAVEETNSEYDLKNLTTENYTSWSGIYDDPGLYYNLDLTPARMLINNFGRWLNISLQDLTGYLKYNKAETLSRLITLRSDETSNISECADILLSILETPIMTGDVLEFDYPLSTEDISTINSDFYGQIQLWDYSEKKTNGGWIRNITAQLPKGMAHIELYETVTLAELIGYKLTMEGAYKLTMEGGLKKLMN